MRPLRGDCGRLNGRVPLQGGFPAGAKRIMTGGFKVKHFSESGRRYPFRAVLLYFALAAVLIAADQLVKQLVVTKFQNADLPLIGNFIHLYYVENTGMAFSMLQGKTLLLIVSTAAMVAVCVYLLIAQKLEGWTGNVSLALICAGGAGNLIDRIFRGYVIDYIYPKFINFAIFNIADMCVVAGAAVLCLWLLLSGRPKQGRGDASK